MDYPGKVIRKTAVTPSQTSASGVWTVDDALQAVKTNTWPIAGVPNPISRSLRFNAPDSTYLSRTPASSGNRKTWTWSAWVKRTLQDSLSMLTQYTDGTNQSMCSIRNNTTGTNPNTIRFYDLVGGSFTTDIYWSPVYRDVSAWYHIVLVADTTQSTNTNRIKLYVNGVQVTATISATWPAQNTDLRININSSHFIGQSGAFSDFADGYMAEINFVDGQALTQSDFGLTDPQTGQWVPKKYTGTYGTNGFYLNFKDNSSTGTLGYDYSGNSNNWTSNNFSVTAGAGNDSLTDVPTQWIGYNTSGDTGGIWRGNYCTLNPLAISTSDRTYTNGNLEVSISVNNLNVFGSMQIPTTGKWYWEHQITTIGGGSAPMGGVAAGSITDLSNAVVYRTNGDKIVNGSGSAYGATYTTTDIIGVAVNVDSGTVTFYKNGSSQGAITFSAGGLFPLLRANAAPDAFVINFGQRPFAYAPPAGFLSLCTTNLPTPTIGATSTTQANDYFDVNLWTGNGTSQSIVNSGSMQPDFVWVKQRSSTQWHRLVDAVRGTNKILYSNDTSAEFTDSTQITAFNSNGFSVGSEAGVNANSATYVGWQWKANGAGSTNNAGSIQSTVSANTTAGFSIVTYTGTGSGTPTVGHGLGVAPSMIIVKSRSNSVNWGVGHASVGWSQAALLNLTNAFGASTYFASTAPTSTVFSIQDTSVTNISGATYVAYCFAAVAGYSAFGSLTGNGSTDGPMIFTGFAPKYVIIKRTDSTGGWPIIDSVRQTYNQNNTGLLAESSAAEYTNGGAGSLDFLSNGFKLRTTDTWLNASGGTYVYAAFAEFPFKFSNAR